MNLIFKCIKGYTNDDQPVETIKTLWCPFHIHVSVHSKTYLESSGQCVYVCELFYSFWIHAQGRKGFHANMFPQQYLRKCYHRKLDKTMFSFSTRNIHDWAIIKVTTINQFKLVWYLFYIISEREKFIQISLHRYGPLKLFSIKTFKTSKFVKQK